MAPKPKPIDYDVVRKLASIGCTDSEIGTVIGLSREWVCKRRDRDELLREAIESGRDHGKTTLRRLQWQAAQAGNPTMLIWLGKQLLGQRDQAAVEHSGPGGSPLGVVVRFEDDGTKDDE